MNLIIFKPNDLFLKTFQAVAAVVTIVTQEEAPGAAGCEVHTDDVIPQLQSILAFMSRL